MPATDHTFRFTTQAMKSLVIDVLHPLPLLKDEGHMHKQYDERQLQDRLVESKLKITWGSRTPLVAPKQDEWDTYAKKWYHSKTRGEIIKILNNVKNREALQRIKRIVCFGLGAFPEKSGPRERCYLQHLVAKEISEIVGQNNNNNKQGVEIKPFDPEYTKENLEFLKKHIVKPFKTFEGGGMGLEPYFTIDKETMVMVPSSEVPIRRILAEFHDNDQLRPAAVLGAPLDK